MNNQKDKTALLSELATLKAKIKMMEAIKADLIKDNERLIGEVAGIVVEGKEPTPEANKLISRYKELYGFDFLTGREVSNG